MSDASHEKIQPKAEYFEQRHVGNLPLYLLVLGGASLVISLVWGLGFSADHSQFAYSWLFAFMYFFTLIIGSMFWTLVHHATDAEWSVLMRRVLENVAVLIPWIFLFFIPLLFCAPLLWTWWNMSTDPHVNPTLAAKQPFLTHTFFFIRLAAYFIGLSLVARAMMRNSTAQDKDGHPKYTIAMRKWAFGGIPILGVSLTFAAVDWLMGLDYHWFSTMWGVYIFAGSAGSGMCLLVLLTTYFRSKGYLQHVTVEHYHIMGKLMLAFCIFWAYIGFDQYMLIWYANIPEETSYFIRRNISSWWYLSTFLVFFRFFLLLPILLQQSVKKKPKQLCMVAGWILFMQMVDIYVIVLPMYHKDGFRPHLLDLLSLVSIGAPLAFLFIKNLGKHSLYPIRDPRLQQSIKLTN